MPVTVINRYLFCQMFYYRNVFMNLQHFFQNILYQKILFYLAVGKYE